MRRMQRKQRAVGLEARRARVAELAVARLSYRAIAQEVGCALGTVAADMDWLRRRWSRGRGDRDEQLFRAALELDWLQGHIIGAMERLPPEDRAPLIGQLLRVMDMRNRLFGLYPRAPRRTPPLSAARDTAIEVSGVVLTMTGLDRSVETRVLAIGPREWPRD